jgi:hypothetical protein
MTTIRELREILFHEQNQDLEIYGTLAVREDYKTHRIIFDKIFFADRIQEIDGYEAQEQRKQDADEIAAQQDSAYDSPYGEFDD